MVFDSVGSATTALRSLQGFQFFGKPLRIVFARGKSDAVALRQGQYEPKAKRQKREKAEREGGVKKEEGRKEGGGGPRVGGEGRAMEKAVASGEVSSMLMAQDLPGEINEEVSEEEEEGEEEEERLGILYGDVGFLSFSCVSKGLDNSDAFMCISRLPSSYPPSLPPSLPYRCWASCLPVSMASTKFVWRGNEALPLSSSGMSSRQARPFPVLMNISYPPHIR